MNKRFLLLCLMAGLALPAALHEAPGQDRPSTDFRSDSHVTIPGAIGDPDQAQRLLTERLHRAEKLSKLEKMLQADPELLKLAEKVAQDPGKFGITRKEIEKLAQQMGVGKGRLKPDLNDPNWQKLLDQAIKQAPKEGVPDSAIRPELRERWEELSKELRSLKDAAGDQQSPSNGTRPRVELHEKRADPPPLLPKPSSQTDAPPAPPEPPATGPAAGPPDAPAPSAQAAGQSGDVGAQDQFTKSLLDWAERLGHKNGLLQQSPAMRDALRDLSHIMDTEGNHGLVKDQAKRLSDQLPSLASYFHLDHSGVGTTLLSHAPEVKPGKTGFTVRPPAGWQAPHAVTPPAATAGGLQALLWLAVLGVLGFALWRLLAWRQARVAAAGEWRLGPWPVHPTAVRTRGDLVRAFEHLSLLLLGRPARTWNHLEIAARLGADPGQGTAAAHLASLYEQARYAPPAEILPDADLAAARRHLCLLAGVPAA